MSQFFAKSNKIRFERYNKLYHDENMSWGEIAKLFDTYPNRVRRDAHKLGVKSRDKSEAQKVALSEGRQSHPTEGKKQSQATKNKISESQGQVWDTLTAEDRERRSKIGVEAWNKKTDSERADFFKRSQEAIQRASQHGSKVELFLFDNLVQNGYRVDKHKEHLLQNERFHIDLYVPSCRVAIEVDGPIHFEPLFGQEKLEKRQALDQAKNGLILSAGMALIRVRLNKRESQRYLRTIWSNVSDILNKVEDKFPPKHERYFEI